MRRAGLSGLIRRRRGRTTIRVQGVRTAPDLVERDFNPTAPDRLWCADITYIRTWEGWLYLASVMGCYSRRIVGWAMADHMGAELVSTRSRWPSRGAGRRAGRCITPIRAARAVHVAGLHPALSQRRHRLVDGQQGRLLG